MTNKKENLKSGISNRIIDLPILGQDELYIVYPDKTIGVCTYAGMTERGTLLFSCGDVSYETSDYYFSMKSNNNITALFYKVFRLFTADRSNSTYTLFFCSKDKNEIRKLLSASVKYEILTQLQTRFNYNSSQGYIYDHENYVHKFNKTKMTALCNVKKTLSRLMKELKARESELETIPTCGNTYEPVVGEEYVYGRLSVSRKLEGIYGRYMSFSDRNGNKYAIPTSTTLFKTKEERMADSKRRKTENEIRCIKANIEVYHKEMRKYIAAKPITWPTQTVEAAS